MKKIYRAMAGFFLAALLAVGLVSLFTTGSGTVGVNTQKPQFSMQALLDGTFISQLETYYANTFPMRDTLLKANRWLNGFYHSSAGDDNILVLGGNTGAEQGGESLARQEYEKTGQTLENEPSSAQESSGDADIPGDVTGTEETLPENQNGDTQTPPEEETIPELDNPDISEAQYAGNVVIVGNRAMEIPTATDSVIESYEDSQRSGQRAGKRRADHQPGHAERRRVLLSGEHAPGAQFAEGHDRLLLQPDERQHPYRRRVL